MWVDVIMNTRLLSWKHSVHKIRWDSKLSKESEPNMFFFLNYVQKKHMHSIRSSTAILILQRYERWMLSRSDTSKFDKSMKMWLYIQKNWGIFTETWNDNPFSSVYPIQGHRGGWRGARFFLKCKPVCHKANAARHNNSHLQPILNHQLT